MWIIFFFFYLIIGNECFGDTTEPEKGKNFHFEISRNINWLNNDYGKWKSYDVLLRYSGFKKFTPMATFSKMTRKSGTQYAYGAGSYIFLNSDFYMIANVSGAPVKDPDVIYYPRLRLDVSGYLNIPPIEGFVLSGGITHFPEQNGASGDIYSLGFLYYTRIIFTGLVHYNVSRPGNHTSISGQASFMYGQEGKYWFGGGGAYGKVAYETVSEIPFDVRFESLSGYLFYNRWVGKNWGIKARYDYVDLRGAYRLSGITFGFFVDF